MTTKTFLITGATAGIGRTTALHLAKQGHVVFATGRNVALLDALATEAAGTKLTTLTLDVTDAESIAAAARQVDVATNGVGLDVLVNNAGYGQLGPIEAMTTELLQKQFDTNVFGLVAVTRAFLPKMRQRGRGRVINVSSVGGRLSMPFMGAYTATKFAVEGLTDALRVELQPFGVDVVIVQPGYIRTNFAETSMDALKNALKGTPWAALGASAASVLGRFEATASDPIVVAQAIERAATTRWPRARYVAPWWASVSFALTWLPTAFQDFVIRKALTAKACQALSTASLAINF